MKSGILILMTTAIILSACSSSSNTARSQDRAESFERTAALIESGNFQFTARSASPTGGRTVQITSYYAMKAADGSYEALLPYFGRAYSGGYGQSGSVEFKGEPENLQIERNDNKHKISLRFSISSSGEKYDVKLDIGSSGYGNLVISSSKRQSISYNGLIGEPEN